MKRTSSRPALTAIVIAATAASIGAVPGRARAQATSDDDRKARELFRMGDNHYIAGRYEKAAVMFEEAFQLSGRIELRIALANAYERMGSYDQAIDQLREYLKSPKAKNVNAVRDRLQRLESSLRARDEERDRLRRLELAEQQRARQQRLRQQRQEQGPRGAEVAGSTSDEVTVRRGPSRLPGYLFLAGGAVGVGSAVAFAILARRAHQDAEDLCVEGKLCPSSAERALDREERWALAADISAVVGIGSAAAGAFLWWRARGESRETESSLRLQGGLLPGGGGVGIAGAF
jgi:tetratricopeptide (TPR) repeat protein